MYLVAGLGNPGREYEGTRHNIGFMVLDYMSQKFGFNISKIKFKGLIGEYVLKGEKILFLKPSTFMNLSGESIREAADFYNIPKENIIIIYDDMALEVGRLRIRPSGSDGGHNGMKSIIYQLNSKDFPRVRVGIGKSNYDTVSHVLGKFSKDEKELIVNTIEMSSDAVQEIIENGVQSAMNKYNSYDASVSTK
jgi:PTH1 family peptidyl-tRNA hydrolase